MSEHLPESTIGHEVTAYCHKCKRPTAHRVDRVAVGSHAGKPGPCLEHSGPYMTQDQIARREYLREQSRQGKLFGDQP